MKPSASTLAVLPHCRHYAGPGVAWPPFETSEAAEFGNAVHAFAEQWIRHRNKSGPLSKRAKATLAEHETTPRFIAVAARLLPWLEANYRPNWRPEVAFAWEYMLDMGREVLGEYQRDYRSVTATEIAGTADICALGEVAEIYDFKTGKSGPEAYAWQMRALAIACSRAWNVSTVRAVLVYVNEDGVREHEATFDGLELDAAADDLRAWLQEAHAGADPNPGPWCSSLYCNARTTCPATTAAIAELAPSADLSRLAVASIRTPEDAGKAYVKLRVIKDAVRAIDDRIREVVEKQGDAPTSGDKVLRLIESKRETFSVERVPADRKAIIDELRAMGALKESRSSCPKEVKR